MLGPASLPRLRSCGHCLIPRGARTSRLWVGYPTRTLLWGAVVGGVRARVARPACIGSGPVLARAVVGASSPKLRCQAAGRALEPAAPRIDGVATEPCVLANGSDGSLLEPQELKQAQAKRGERRP